jgi:hypothetical protein
MNHFHQKMDSFSSNLLFNQPSFDLFDNMQQSFFKEKNLTLSKMDSVEIEEESFSQQNLNDSSLSSQNRFEDNNEIYIISSRTNSDFTIRLKMQITELSIKEHFHKIQQSFYQIPITNSNDYYDYYI